MLEAVNLLPINRRLKQLKARLHGHTWAGVRASICRPDPLKMWWNSSKFGPNFTAKGLFEVREVKSEEFGAGWGKIEGFFLELEWLCVWRAAHGEEEEDDREASSGEGGHMPRTEKKPSFKTWHGVDENAPHPLVFFWFQACSVISTANQISYPVFHTWGDNTIFRRLFAP